MKLKTCVSPEGFFVYGLHKPDFKVANHREKKKICQLGVNENGDAVLNHPNYPDTSVEELNADIIYEIPNPFAFRGTTFINSAWADVKSKNPLSISLPKPAPLSFTKSMIDSLGAATDIDKVFSNLPQQVLLTIAAESTDPEELSRLAFMSCEFYFEEGSENPVGIRYKNGRAVIKNHTLFESVVNNSCLPENLLEIMVLRPGVQGNSEIMAEFSDARSHIYEYLRRNSYIPWGHFAANMAEDAIRYDMADMTISDMKGLRHLYYQRTYSRLGELLGVSMLNEQKQATEDDLEEQRKAIINKISTEKLKKLPFTATLWGWNYGFNFTPAGFNLHGSHQQIHQQYALIPETVPAQTGFGTPAEAYQKMETYGCGDQVYQFIKNYREEYGSHFFDNYISAIRNNKRMDKKDDSTNSLIVYEDDNILLFVPKAQTSQWELNLVTKEPLGNILETDTGVRASLDQAIFKAMNILTKLGARMVTVIEFSGRFVLKDEKQHLMYAFLPKIPYSMGAFTEAQLRYINGHFPEDFACACRKADQK